MISFKPWTMVGRNLINTYLSDLNRLRPAHALKTSTKIQIKFQPVYLTREKNVILCFQ